MAVQTERPETPPQSSDIESAPRVNEWHCAKPIRILVIDDDEAICQVIETALADVNFRVDSISDPLQIERRLQTGPEDAFHLILLDYILPGVEPEQVFAWLVEHQPEASIIVITGNPSFDSALNCLRAHTYDYVTKPFELTGLRRVVMRCLESKGLLRLSEGALREALGTAIRERRKTLGLTLVQLASRTEVSVGYLSQIELGRNSGSIETLYRICLALGMKLSELFQTVQRTI